MLAGLRVPAGHGFSTIMADMDFETYSEAGYARVPDPKKPGGFKWQSATGKANTAGIKGVGAPAYSEHPSTEILWLVYDLKQGDGPVWWWAGMPYDVLEPLFDHIRRGGLIAAWNSAFEFWIWKNVGHARMGWPPLARTQLRCDQAKAHAWALPGQLELAAKAINPNTPKDPRGKALIKMFSRPRTATKADPVERFTQVERPEEFFEFGEYCQQDIIAEAGIAQKVPDLSPDELEMWLVDQQINERGVAIDLESLANLTTLVDSAVGQYTAELQAYTLGKVKNADSPKALKDWLHANGCMIPNCQADTLQDWLAKWDKPKDHVHRVLGLQCLIGSNSVKKLAAIKRRLTRDGRLHDLFQYHGPHTGRWAGRGPQPQNLPSSGPDLARCESCGKHYGTHAGVCPWCGCAAALSETVEWCPEAVEDVLQCVNHFKGDLQMFEHYYGDAVATAVGCLRGLFVAGPGKELISSDYSAIEAVVLACLANETWRIVVFRTHGKIYEMAAAKASGLPFDEILAHKEQTGKDHPLRKKLGKVGELAFGYQGGVGAAKNFGADQFFEDDDAINAFKKQWRSDSPNIEKFWYGVQDASIKAVMNPGQCFSYGPIAYGMKGGDLYCQLPSGRCLTYHDAYVIDDVTPWGKTVKKLHFWGYNSDSKKGPVGWLSHDTYGGKLTENIVQAVARDIMAHAIKQLEKRGYHIVLHVHDEVVVEVPEGWGTIEELESIMADLPHWCADWPIKASGGWSGYRFRKD